MSLVIEDGTAKTNAEAWATVVAADAYYTGFGGPSGWADLTEAQKEVKLRVGARYLKSKYEGQWRGRKLDEDQSLPWPRAWAVDNDGFMWESDEIPAELVNANILAAFKAVADDLMPDVDDAGPVVEKSVRVGPISESTKYAGSASQLREYTSIFFELKSLLEPRGASKLRRV